MANYRVSLSFTSLPDAELDEFAANIAVALTGNPSFPTPLVTIPVLTAGQQAFHSALLAAANGGVVLTALKNEKRDALETLLRKEASYVQGVASQNLPVLLSSNFAANSTNQSQSPLDTPTIHSVENGQSTQLVLRVNPVVNSKALEVQVKNGGGWLPMGVFTKLRGIVLPGLVPGQVYAVQARAVGGSTGYSDWSDSVSHMVM